MTVAIRAEPGVAARLAELAGGRPLLIDHYASRRCGATVGDLRLRFGDPAGGADVVALHPIGPVRVLAEPSLVELFGSGASLRADGLLGSRLRIELDRPESWLDFLDAHPASRR